MSWSAARRAPRLTRSSPRSTARWRDAGRVLARGGEIRARLASELHVEFNSCLLNRYRDGGDSIAWHADDEPELGPEPTIASVSLGARRTFAARHRATRERHDWVLGAGDLLGDLLVMSGRSQVDWEHSVPKRAVAGERMNLTFRLVNAR